MILIQKNLKKRDKEAIAALKPKYKGVIANRNNGK